MKEFDKAEWSTTNTRIFCELCVKQIEASNRPIGIMTTRGYQNIAIKYLLKTGLRHSKIQLKNRWDILKAMYSFWLGLLKDTGLGWDSTKGTVSASDEYWKQGHSKWTKLQHGPPDFEDLLSQMFGEVVVDGSSACAPREDVGGAGIGMYASDDEDEDETFVVASRQLDMMRKVGHVLTAFGTTDGTHIPIIVPTSKVVPHVGRNKYPTQNVLAVCDFDMRFTFIVAEWPGSAHDMRVFNDALRKYAAIFPHAPSGNVTYTFHYNRIW